MTPYPEGIDISSHWQGLIDAEKAKARGALFVYHNGGIGRHDPPTGTFANWNACPKAGMMNAWYFPVNPFDDVPTQLDRMLHLLKGFPGDLPPWVDSEIKHPSLGEATLRIVNAFARKLGMRPDIYYNLKVSLEDITKDVARAFALGHIAVASYNGLPAPTMPLFAHAWEFWQHSADGNNLGAAYGVESASVDLDYYNGTYQDLLDLHYAYRNALIESGFVADVLRPSDRISRKPRSQQDRIRDGG